MNNNHAPGHYDWERFINSKNIINMEKELENYIRHFMSDCQKFWSRQWFINDSKKPQAFSFNKSLVGVYADVKGCFLDKKIKEHLVTEDELKQLFETEFSDSWEHAKNNYIPKSIIDKTVIANGDSIYRAEGIEGLQHVIDTEYNNA